MTRAKAREAEIIPVPKRLKGRNILLTGAHTDLGHALALSLATQGASLLLLARKERLLATLYDQIMEKEGAEPLLIAMDVASASEEDFAALEDGLRNEVGVLHSIVNADIPAAPLSPLVNTSLETWNACFHGMLIRPMLMVRNLLPLLQQADSASVVFLTLPCGRLGKANWTAVGAALAGLENLCQALAVEHPEIRFNTLDPGPVGSDLRRRYYPAEARADLLAVDDASVMQAFLDLLLVSEQADSAT